MSTENVDADKRAEMLREILEWAHSDAMQRDFKREADRVAWLVGYAQGLASRAERVQRPSPTESLERVLEQAITEIRENAGPSTEADEALERAVVATKVEVAGLVRRVGDALHAAGLEPTPELSRALLYLGVALTRGGAL